MRHRWFPPLAAISILLCARPAATARRPHYGGTLRVEIGAAVNSLDPGVAAANAAEAAAKEQIDFLIYAGRNTEGEWTGAGPFRISAWDPGKRVALAANDDGPGGRPFLDSVEIQMQRPADDRLLDLQLGRADFAQIPPQDARRAAERGIRVSASQPDELIAIVFPDLDSRGREMDPRARQALSLAVDRAALANVVLQHEAEPAGGILPQWCSGTAFLFPTAPDSARARVLWSQIVGSSTIVLGYDADDMLEKAIADRVVVDAAAAGISARSLPSTGAMMPNAELIRWRIPAPHAYAALAGFLRILKPFAGEDAALADASALSDSAADVFRREQQLISSGRVVPLVWTPQVYGIGSRVRDWTPPRPGERWPLANVWLDGASAAGEPAQ